MEDATRSCGSLERGPTVGYALRASARVGDWLRLSASRYARVRLRTAGTVSAQESPKREGAPSAAMREVAALKCLPPHPNVIGCAQARLDARLSQRRRLIDVELDATQMSIVLEYAALGTVYRALRKCLRNLPQAERMCAVKARGRECEFRWA